MTSAADPCDMCFAKKLKAEAESPIISDYVGLGICLRVEDKKL